MKSNISASLALYILAILLFLYSIVDIFSSSKIHSFIEVENISYRQPPIGSGNYPWSVRSIDTQVISKHWPDVSKEAVKEQVAILKGLGVNYIAIGTPYDRLDDMKIWVEEIHANDINVWFRSHWAEWEGDEGRPDVMSPEEYLTETKKFIINNPDLFKEGDAFTFAVEAEQVGVGLGRKFLTWDEYGDFLLAEIALANEAFRDIGFERKVHTNWLSMNGWVVMNRLTPELVEKMDLIVVDHFVEQERTLGKNDDLNKMVEQTLTDLDIMYLKWKKPILLGEWGYQIYQEVSDETQSLAVEKLFSELVKRNYLVGVNYWVHMGNSAAIIDDEYGSNLRVRGAAEVIKKYYIPLEE